MDGKKSVFEIVADAADAVGTVVATARESYCSCSWLIKPKQLIMVLLGLAVFFCGGIWLLFPPKPSHPHHSHQHGHSIVATFKLPKPVSVVKDHVRQLETNLDYVYRTEYTKVIVLSVESNGSYTTDVAFAVDSASKHSIPIENIKNIRLNFASFYLGISTLQMVDAPLFGVPHSFEVVKFPGGITISPKQTLYPPEKLEFGFNFTLNNPILHITKYFGLMKSQLATALHLTRNEMLYLDLINYSGSTMSPPTTVKASVMQKVGVPVEQRRQQLAQAVRDLATTNLGLNTSVFGIIDIHV